MRRLATEQTGPAPGTKLIGKMVYANDELTRWLTNHHRLQKLGFETI